MEYLLVTTDTQLLRYVNDHYHTRCQMDCGVIVETNSTVSETEELFTKLHLQANEAFTIVCIPHKQRFGCLESTMDICSTSWIKG